MEDCLFAFWTVLPAPSPRSSNGALLRLAPNHQRLGSGVYLSVKFQDVTSSTKDYIELYIELYPAHPSVAQIKLYAH